MKIMLEITEEDFIKDKNMFAKLRELMNIKSAEEEVEQHKAALPPTTEAARAEPPARVPMPQGIAAAPVVPVASSQTSAAVLPVAPTAPAAEYTLDRLAQACGALIDAGKIEELTDLLNKQFNVAALPNLPKEQYNAFAVAIREMGAQV